jgi:hypothetical protein
MSADNNVAVCGGCVGFSLLFPYIIPGAIYFPPIYIISYYHTIILSYYDGVNQQKAQGDCERERNQAQRQACDDKVLHVQVGALEIVHDEDGVHVGE